MKPTRTWILVADSGRARVLQWQGPGKGLDAIPGLTREADLPRTHEIMSDRQGRSFEAAGNTRHPLEPRTDPREKLKEDFLAGLAAEIDRHCYQGDFDRLVVVAPPEALGTLRAAFSDRVKAATMAELAKDLTKTPDHDLPDHLGTVMNV